MLAHKARFVGDFLNNPHLFWAHYHHDLIIAGIIALVVVFAVLFSRGLITKS